MIFETWEKCWTEGCEGVSPYHGDRVLFPFGYCKECTTPEKEAEYKWEVSLWCD